MLAYTYPLLDLFGTMLGFFVFIIWFWLLIIIFTDIFRSRDMGGGAKALWVIFVIILPFLGILIYLIARGGKMHEHQIQQAQAQKSAMDDYIRETASSPADELAKLHDLKTKGALTDCLLYTSRCV